MTETISVGTASISGRGGGADDGCVAEHVPTEPLAATGVWTQGVGVEAHRMQQLDPRTLLVDLNVRHVATADADLVASVAEHGVLVPIVAVRTEQGEVRVRMGHRRTLAAIKAECATVPVVVVADEVSDDAGTVHRLVRSGRRTSTAPG